MDTTVVKERSYRQVEALRRENLREQRRLSERLHSKTGMDAAMRQQVESVSKEQRRIKRELAKIKKSTSSCMGQLPPRIDSSTNPAPLFDSNLSNEHLNGSNRIRKKGIMQFDFADNKPKKLGDSSLNGSGLAVIMSEKRKSNYGLEDVLDEPTEEEIKQMQRVRRRSIHQINKENKKTEETLKKFNETFPGDVDLTVPVNIVVNDVPDGAGTNPVLEHGTSEENSNAQTSGGPRKIRPKSEGDKGSEKVPQNNLSRAELNKSEMSLPSRKLSVDERSVSSSRNALSRESLSKSDSSPTPRRSSQSTTTITDINIQEARDNVVKRLAPGETQMSSAISVTSQVNAEVASPRVPRVLTPIQEKSLAKKSLDPATSDKDNPKNNKQISNVTEIDIGVNKNVEGESNPAEEKSESHTPENSNEVTKPKQIKRKKKRKDIEQTEPTFDPLKYNPDGTLRTVHLLPDFKESLKEAEKARYLRLKYKTLFERELTVRDIFAKDANGAYR